MEKAFFNLEDSLGYLTNRAGKTMLKALTKRLKDEAVAIPPAQWMILFKLWFQDGLNQKDLVFNHFKDKGTITRGIGQLENLGLVIRVTDENDKRNKKIFLTKKGWELQEVVRPIIEDIRGQATKGIPGEELETCKKVLQQIYQNLVCGKL